MLQADVAEDLLSNFEAVQCPEDIGINQAQTLKDENLSFFFDFDSSQKGCSLQNAFLEFRQRKQVNINVFISNLVCKVDCL